MRALAALIFFVPRSSLISNEDCFSVARSYSSRSAFAKGSPRHYHALWRRGLLDEAFRGVQVSPVYVPAKWTHELVFAEAAKYRTRAEFKRECGGAHSYALKHGILAQACAHMRDGHNFWHVFELMAVASKYKDKPSFTKAESSAYNFCKKNGLVDLVCAHMAQRRDWSNKHDVLAEAARHQSRGAFQVLASGAFKQAYAGGYLDQACAHMPPPEYGFSKEKPAILYHLRVTAADGAVLYKIGITNRDPTARIAGMGAFPGVVIELLETIAFTSGRDARIAEKRLHRKFSSHRYTGAPLMKNGNTELFTVNVLDL